MSEQKNEITKLALKLAGVYVLVQAILYIPSIVSIVMMFGQPGVKSGSLMLFISFALLVILGWWLVYKNKPELGETNQMNTDYITMGIVIAGIIVFATAISDLPYLIAMLGYGSTPGFLGNIGINGNLRNTLPKLLGNLIQIALGGALFFRAKYFTKLIK